MKKLFALVLALAMALSCTLALAEEAEIPESLALTITSDVTIDQEALLTYLPMFGVDESSLSVIQAVLPILANCGSRLTVADGGLQLDLRVNGNDAASVAGALGEAGLVLVSSLIPNYKLTLSYETLAAMMESYAGSMETLSNLDPTAAIEAISGYMETYMTACQEAVSFGEPETGAFEYQGYAFDARTPIIIDLPAIIAAAQQMYKSILEDPTVLELLDTLNASGMNVNVEEIKQSLEAEIPAENVPDVDVWLYTNSEEDELTYVNVAVTPKGAESALTVVDVLVAGDAVQVNVDIPEEQTTVTVNVLPNDAGVYVRADIDASGMYAGLGVDVAVGEALVVDTALYFLDAENPLVREVITVEEGGQLTLDVSGEGKTELPIENLMNSEDDSAAQSLAMDFMMYGLGSLMNAVPEASGLLGALMGGAMSGDTAA